MKHHIGLTIEAQLLKEIETLRGREKRSTFMEHLLRLGLKTYKTENKPTSFSKSENHPFKPQHKK